jgi:hypothetical protein
MNFVLGRMMTGSRTGGAFHGHLGRLGAFCGRRPAVRVALEKGEKQNQTNFFNLEKVTAAISPAVAPLACSFGQSA